MNRLKIVELDKSLRHCPLYRSTDFSAFPSSERQAIEREGERGGRSKKNTVRQPICASFRTLTLCGSLETNQFLAKRFENQTRNKEKSVEKEQGNRIDRLGSCLFVRSGQRESLGFRVEATSIIARCSPQRAS